MPTPEYFLDVQRVSTVFESRRRSVVAVDDVSFGLPADKPTLLTIVGESGSGKTTLARNLLGLTRPTSGTIFYRGKNIQLMSGQEWLTYRREVQPVFQDPYATYNPFYRVDRVLKVPLKKFKLSDAKSQADDLIDAALRAVDLRPGDVRGRYSHQLSGGERQRIMLARIYLIRPKLILADEPVSMIDASLRTLFLNILLDFRDQYGISCVHITHNLATAYYLGGEIMIMCRGRIIERGNMDVVLADPKHPYTQLLVESVPSPDPANRWKRSDRGELSVETAALRSDPHACVFVQRCPYAMAICRERRPEMRHVSREQAVACFLYDAGDVSSPSNNT